MMEADFSQVRQVGARIEANTRRVAVEAGKVLLASTLKVESSAKGNAPVRTGTLRRSIHHEIRGTADGAEGIVGTNVPYGRRIEHGFVGADSLGRVYNQAPRPYLGPALDQHTPGFQAAMAELGADVLR